MIHLEGPLTLRTTPPPHSLLEVEQMKLCVEERDCSWVGAFTNSV